MLNENLWYAIYTALTLSMISSVILALQKREYRYFLIFSVLCAYIISTEVYGGYLLQRKKSITKLYNIEQIIEHITLMLIQTIICRNKFTKKAMLVIVILLFLIISSIHLFVIDINKENTMVYSILIIFTILFCFYNLAQIMFSLNDIPLQYQPNLLHNTAIVLFYGTAFILQSSYSLLVGLPKVFLNNITTFLYIVYAATYFIHTWAFCTQIDFHKLHPRRWFKFNSFSFTKQPFK
jgi:hypothetical protein